MGDFRTEPEIPQVQFLEPSNHQTSAGPFPEYQYCWESGGKAPISVTGSWKSSGMRPHWASSTPCSLTLWQKYCHPCKREERRRTYTTRALKKPGFPKEKMRTLTLLCPTRHTPGTLKERMCQLKVGYIWGRDGAGVWG